jgi:Tat protein secretion system quality control protein TatD with DNase activity
VRVEIVISDIEKGIKSEILAEIESLEGDYTIIKNFLTGTEYELKQIRVTLHSFKNRLSKIRSLLVTYFHMQGSFNFNFQTRPLQDSIDTALLLIEANPPVTWQNARAILQMCLTMSTIKIEDTLSFISTLKRTAFS